MTDLFAICGKCKKQTLFINIVSNHATCYSCRFTYSLTNKPEYNEKEQRTSDSIYPLFLAFDLREGKITFDTYIEKINRWRNR